MLPKLAKSLIKHIFLAALIINSLSALAQQDPRMIAFTPEKTFRPAVARYWEGSVEDHRFSENASKSAVFPPFRWEADEFREGEAWYEFEVPDTEIPNEFAGILITRMYLNANVFLNGSLIGSGGTMSAPIAKNSHRPLYFSIPETAWNDSGNTIRIQHKSYPGMGYIVDLLIGSDSVLRPIYEQRNFRQQTLPKTLFIIEILSGLILFYVWLLNKEEKSYLWFAFSMLMVSLFTSNQFVTNTIVPHYVWLALNNTSLDWWSVSLIMFVNTKLNIDRPIIFKTLMAYSLFVLVYYFSLSLSELPGTAGFHLLSMLFAFTNVFYMIFKAPRREALPYILFFVSIQLFSIHDMLMHTGIWLVRWLDGQFILFYAAPMACILVFAKIIREFVMAMQAKKEHAENLEMHIKLTKQEFEAQYERLNSVAAEQAMENERARIYRDLHDDVGSKLLSLFYRADDAGIETIAKSALEDLREIVSRKTLDGEMLEKAISQWEEEVRLRVEEKGIALVWKNSALGKKIKLSETQYTHLKRMLREAVSNALKHNPSSKEIEVSVSLESGVLTIVVSNDGVEVDVSEWKYGHGINNMKIRTRELGGSFDVSTVALGQVRLTLAIPL